MQVKLTTDTNFQKRDKKKSSPVSSPDAPSRSPFLTILDEVLPSHQEESRDLHQLWSQLPDLEKELLDNPSEANLTAYRETVRSIARQTLDRNVKLKKIHRRTRLGETVELNAIQVLDDRLHRMALMMQSRNNSAFQLLRQMEEIRGLLLDLRE